MIIEYRSTGGAADFKSTTGERITLRNLGCPEWIIKRVIESRAKRNAGREVAPAPVAAPQADADALRERLHSVSIL